MLQNRIERFYLGVHRFAPLAATWIELDWLNIGQVRKIEMMRLMNRIALMPESRLPKKVLRWEVINGCCAWLGEVLDICKELEIPSPIGPYMSLYTYDIEVLEKRALHNARVDWRQQVPMKSKLCTYAQVRDFTINAQLVTLNLPRGQRSAIAKLFRGFCPSKLKWGGSITQNGNSDFVSNATQVKLKMKLIL